MSDDSICIGNILEFAWPNLQYQDTVTCQRPLCELVGARFPVLALEEVILVNPEKVSLNQELLAIVCFTMSVPNWLVFR